MEDYVFYFNQELFKGVIFQKQKKYLDIFGSNVSSSKRSRSRAHLSIFEEIFLLSFCPQQTELNCLCPLRLEA